MEIVKEFIVMDESNNFFKVLLLDSGMYLKYVDRAGRYEEIDSDYFEICKNRMA